MTTMTPRITALPDEVISQIKSFSTITSLNCVVLGLVKNSIDAEAQNVNIILNHMRGDCVVEDDGIGIAQAEFLLDGGLGKSYHTSKYPATAEKYGCQGSFIASLTAVSFVTIMSRQRGRKSLNEVVFQRKKATRFVPTASHNDLTLGEYGTRIEVRNLFGSMPVRVKHRAGLDKRIEMERWNATMRGLVELLIAWQRPVNVTLQEEPYSKRFSIRGSIPVGPSSFHHKKCTFQSTSLNVDLCLRMLSQSGLSEPSASSSWVPVAGKTSSLSIKGLISLDPAPNKQSQFISLGIWPISNTFGHNEIYEEINRTFSTSDFGRVENDSVDSVDIDCQKQERTFKHDRPTLKQLKASRKSVDRWPKFYLRILTTNTIKKCSDPTDDFPDYQANLQEILELTGSMITRWLSDYHFGPRRKRANYDVAKSEECLITTEVARSRFSNRQPIQKPPMLQKIPSQKQDTKLVFSAWSKIKSGNRNLCKDLQSNVGQSSDIYQARKSGETPDDSPALSNEDNVTAHDSSRSFLVLNTSSLPSGSPLLANPVSLPHHADRKEQFDDISSWQHPTTKKTYRINVRTGMLLLQNDNTKRISRGEKNDMRLELGACMTRTRDLSISRPVEHTVRQTSRWLERVLKNWYNPVFSCSEREIPQVLNNLSFPRIEARCYKGLHDTSRPLDNLQESLESHFHRFSAHSLGEADVIAQVDRKFILAKVVLGAGIELNESLEGSNDNRMLLLIDQHAADERCKIERLLRELCRPAELNGSYPISNLGFRSQILTATLQKPIHFSTNSQEAQLFRCHAEFFANWGVIYDLNTTSEATNVKASNDANLVIVKTLPTGIAERCAQEPKLLIESLRTEIWKRNGGEAPSYQPSVKQIDFADPHAWVRLISDCPQSILEILNSQSCRSAIMFNDNLSLEQSSDLVRRLADCAFPFQCAHGRPCMVPLVDIFQVPFVADMIRKDPISTSFVKDFKAWRRCVVQVEGASR